LETDMSRTKRHRISIELSKEEYELLTIRCIQHGVRPADLLRKSLLLGIGCIYRNGHLCSADTVGKPPASPANKASGTNHPATPAEAPTAPFPPATESATQAESLASACITLSEAEIDMIQRKVHIVDVVKAIRERTNCALLVAYRMTKGKQAELGIE
jgi:hypothetical protein